MKHLTDDVMLAPYPAVKAKVAFCNELVHIDELRKYCLFPQPLFADPTCHWEVQNGRFLIQSFPPCQLAFFRTKQISFLKWK